MSPEAPPEVEEAAVETGVTPAEPAEAEAPATEAPVAEEASADPSPPEDPPAADAEAPPEEEPAPVVAGPPPSGRVEATGKRKSSIARVVLEPGDGTIAFTDGRSLEEYFGRQTLVAQIRQPLAVAGAEGHYTITARISGGGVGGQAGALRHAIARALIKLDENLRPALKREGFLTRDARIKERKKAGLKGARKRPQFSKR
jgi:small subunit ribosomal protein S9